VYVRITGLPGDTGERHAARSRLLLLVLQEEMVPNGQAGTTCVAEYTVFPLSVFVCKLLHEASVSSCVLHETLHRIHDIMLMPSVDLPVVFQCIR
jgi:hypothetical protein